MDKIGFWKLAEVMRFDENFNRSWQKVEDVMADESLDDSDKNILATVMELTPDGRLLLMMPLPEGVTQEQIDEALASGELKLHENGMMIYETHPWKEEELRMLDDEAFLRLVRCFGPDRVLFGTDSPWGDQSESLQAIRALPLPDADKRAILGGNAEKLIMK